jgi:xanthine/uracil permease
MSGSAEVARFIVALFASGVFWLMVLFFIEKAWLRSRLPGALIMAVLVMTLSALALFTVVDDSAWKVIASQTTPADSGPGTDIHGQN